MFRLAFLLLPAIVLAADPSAHDVAVAFFQGIDANGDGSISRADVDTYFNSNYDTNNDKAVSAAEFKAYVTAKKPELAAYVDAAFGFFDNNSDGKLNSNDYTPAFQAADENGDNSVTQAEFLSVFVPIFNSIQNGK